MKILMSGMLERTSLITGTSKGIGRAIAEQLAASGHQVAGIARRVTLSAPARGRELFLHRTIASAHPRHQG